MAALAAPSPAYPACLFLYFTESTCKSKQSTKRRSEGRILFYHNAQYLLSGCMNLEFAISISLLVLVYPVRPAFALSELSFTVKRFCTLLRSVASASAIFSKRLLFVVFGTVRSKKVEAESCDGFVIGVNLWSSFSLQVCSYDNGFIRRTPLQVAGEKRTSPPRMVCTCEHFNGKLVFYLKYLLFSFRLPPAWSSLCTGGILAGKAAKAVNFRQTAEEALDSCSPPMLGRGTRAVVGQDVLPCRGKNYSCTNVIQIHVRTKLEQRQATLKAGIVHVFFVEPLWPTICMRFSPSTRIVVDSNLLQ